MTILQELMYSITEMNRNKRDILSDMEFLRPNENIPTRVSSAGSRDFYSCYYRVSIFDVILFFLESMFIFPKYLNL